MKTVCFALLLLAFPASAQNRQPVFCCRCPMRAFGDSGSVNLTPLFQWWTNHPSVGGSQPTRPLTAWQRVVGVKTGDLEYRWVVDARIYTNQTSSTPARIVLQNPPVQEAQLYYSLEKQIAGYGLALTNAQRAYQTDFKAEQHAQARANADARSRSWRARYNAGAYVRQAAQERNAARQAQNQEQQPQQALEAARNALNAIPSSKGRYRVDCFALDTGKTFHGLPLYDVGVMIPHSP